MDFWNRRLNQANQLDPRYSYNQYLIIQKMIDIDHINPASLLGFRSAPQQILFNFMLAAVLAYLVLSFSSSSSQDALASSLHQAENISKELETLFYRKHWTQRLQHLFFYILAISLIVALIKEVCQGIDQLQWLSSDLTFVTGKHFKEGMAVSACLWVILFCIGKLLANKISRFNERELKVAQDLLKQLPKEMKEQIQNYVNPQKLYHCIRGCKTKINFAQAQLAIYQELFTDLSAFQFCDACKGKAVATPLEEEQEMSEQERHLTKLLNFINSSCKKGCAREFWSFMTHREKSAERRLSQLLKKIKSRR